MNIEDRIRALRDLEGFPGKRQEQLRLGLIELWRALQLGDARAIEAALATLRRIRVRALRFEPHIAELLKHPQSSIRVVAARLLARSRSGEGQAALVEALRDAAPEVREAAVEALASAIPRTPELFERLHALLNSNDPEIRLRGLRAYPAHSGEDIAWLPERLRDTDRQVRIEAARLWQLLAPENHELTPAIRRASLEALVDHPDPVQRAGSARYLARSLDPDTVRNLAQAARQDPASQVRSAALEALAHAPCRYTELRTVALQLLDTADVDPYFPWEFFARHHLEATDDLLTALEHTRCRRAAASIIDWLGFYGGQAGLLALRTWLIPNTVTRTNSPTWTQDDVEHLRSTALDAVLRRGEESGALLPEPLQLAQQLDASSLQSTGLILAQIFRNIGQSTRAIEAALLRVWHLASDSKSDAGWVRRTVMDAWAQLDVTSAPIIEILLKAGQDEHSSNRDAARQAISRLGPCIAPQLLAYVDHPSLGPQANLALALVGRPSPESIEQLLDELENEDLCESSLALLRRVKNLPASATDRLIQLSHNERPQVARAAIDIIGGLAPAFNEELAQAFERLLTSDDPELQATALWSLAELSTSPETLHCHVAPLQAHRVPEIRRAAGWVMSTSNISHSDPTAPTIQAKIHDCIREAHPIAQNLILSPYTLQRCLTALESGAAGPTREQLAPWAAADDLAQTPEFQLSTSLWTRPGLVIDARFERNLANNFQAEHHRVDLTHANTLTRMNNWVAERSHGHNPQQLPALPADTEFVLLLIAHFKANWETPFLGGPRAPMTFQRLDGSRTRVPSMTQRLACRTARGSRYRAIELSYEGGRQAMLLVQPDHGFFSRIRQFLDSEGLTALAEQLEDDFIVLTMPPFELETELVDGESIAALGLDELFAHPDFSRLSPELSPGFHGKLMQRYKITVHERGTEASAACGFIGIGSSAEHVDIDGPFLFYIRDIASHALLFSGQVVEP